MKKKHLALVLCILLCVAMAFFAFFSAAEADHDCAGEECQVCLELETCATALKGIAPAVYVVLLFFCVRSVLFHIRRSFFSDDVVNTPVLLRVKLTI